MSRWVISRLFGLMAAGCGASTEGTARVDTPSVTTPSPVAYSAQSETGDDVTTLFLDPAEAELAGGETRTVPGTLSRVNLCVPLNPINTPPSTSSTPPLGAKSPSPTRDA
ncbi:hypothetical protein Pth03_25220 [Planotetraspora thailandica]|uniref:Uncharacterized protein n=1 Tax=Planotetraspora thailandica TaxID=487172 RepID=A0A8J3UYE3_9ACTN|nr:hypothetical protein Pth03_25220 [Planotetraspora thailandica]